MRLGGIIADPRTVPMATYPLVRVPRSASHTCKISQNLYIVPTLQHLFLTYNHKYSPLTPPSIASNVLEIVAFCRVCNCYVLYTMGHVFLYDRFRQFVYILRFFG